MTTSILLTGGIGDVIALEAHMPPALKQRLTTIVWATRRHRDIRPLFDGNPEFPNLVTHVSIEPDWSQQWCFHHKTHVQSAVPFRLDPVEDWSIDSKFREISQGLYTYGGSSFLRRGAIPNHAIDTPYYVVNAYTPTNRPRHAAQRALGRTDWDYVLARAGREGATAVVLGVPSADYVPDHPRVLDLTGKTSLREGIGILAGAVGYLGIDSWLSVLAAQVFDPDHLVVKGQTHSTAFAPIYFAPHRDFDFLVSDFPEC